MTVVKPRLRNMSASWASSRSSDFHSARFHLGSVKWTWAFQKPAVTMQSVAGDLRGAHRHVDILTDRGDHSVANQDRSVVDGGQSGRDIDARITDIHGPPSELEGGMRAVAGKNFDSPEQAAGNNQKNQKQENKTNHYPAHEDLTLSSLYADGRLPVRHSRFG